MGLSPPSSTRCKSLLRYALYLHGSFRNQEVTASLLLAKTAQLSARVLFHHGIRSNLLIHDIRASAWRYGSVCHFASHNLCLHPPIYPPNTVQQSHELGTS